MPDLKALTNRLFELCYIRRNDFIAMTSSMFQILWNRLPDVLTLLLPNGKKTFQYETGQIVTIKFPSTTSISLSKGTWVLNDLFWVNVTEIVNSDNLRELS